MSVADGGRVPIASKAIGNPLVEGHIFFALGLLHGKILTCTILNSFQISFPAMK